MKGKFLFFFFFESFIIQIKFPMCQESSNPNVTNDKIDFSRPEKSRIFWPIHSLLYSTWWYPYITQFIIFNKTVKCISQNSILCDNEIKNAKNFGHGYVTCFKYSPPTNRVLLKYRKMLIIYICMYNFAIFGAFSNSSAPEGKAFVALKYLNGIFQ